MITVAQVKFSTVVNEKQPGLSDYVQVEYTIENAKSVEKISPPSFKNFRVIQGPVQSNGVSYINGTLSQYKSVSYIVVHHFLSTITGYGDYLQIFPQ